MRKAKDPEHQADKSKIGRLPFAIRNRICEMIMDGAASAQICAFVNASPEFASLRRDTGCAPLNAQNVTDFRYAGYIRWRRDRQRTENLRALTESANHIAAASDGNPAAVGSRILAGRLIDMLESVDDASALDLAGALVNLRKGENEAARLELDRRRADLQRESLELEKDKFRRQTCELFLKWYADRKAMAIADGPGTNDEKVKALLAYMDAQEAGGQ